MRGPRNLAAATLALLLAFSVLKNSGGAPQRLLERRNWTPQAMLYLKGARPLGSLKPAPQGPGAPWGPGAAEPLAFAEGRRFISDQSRRKDLSDRLPPERRSPNLQLLTLPEVTALLLAFLEKAQEGPDGEESFDQRRFLEDGVLSW